MPILRTFAWWQVSAVLDRWQHALFGWPDAPVCVPVRIPEEIVERAGAIIIPSEGFAGLGR